MKFTFIVVEAENFAVMLFSRLLKDKNHQVQLVFDPRLFGTDEINVGWLAKLFDIRQQNLKLIQHFDPDYVCFSTYTQDYRWNIEMAKLVKAKGYTTLFGGSHCILCSEEVMKEDCVDILCIGEGEEAILELADGNSPPISNLWFKGQSFPKTRSLVDLDALPLPDRDIFYNIRPLFKVGYTIATSRGCPYACAFCASSALNNRFRELGVGRYLRQRSPRGVIRELVWARERYNSKTVNFVDDNLTLNTKWLEEFSRDYRKWVGIPFYCTSNPATIKERDIELLKEAGCQMIGFGLQSANEETRVKILNRRGTNGRILATTRCCHRNNIRFSFDIISGIPTAKRDEELEALKFFSITRPDVINTFTLVYLPKTQLSKRYGQGNDTSMLRRTSDWFVSMCAILPLLPRWLISLLLRFRLYKLIRLPYWLRMIFKSLGRLKIGRYIDIYFPIQLLLVNVKACIGLKWSVR